MTHNAIILLAGMGSRLKPLTDNRHKALIPFAGKTILERQVTQLMQNGVTGFHFVLGYRDGDIKNFMAEKFPKLHAEFYPNPIFADTNTGYSLLLVLQKLQDAFLLLDGDVMMSDVLIAKLCADTEECLLLCETDPTKLDAEAVKVAITPHPALSPWGEGARRVGGGTGITAIGKHIPLRDAAGESIGVGLYQADWASALKDQLEVAMQDPLKKKTWYYEDAMNVILGSPLSLPSPLGGRVSPLTGTCSGRVRGALSPLHSLSTGSEPWVDVDDHADLARANSLFA